MYIHTCWIMFDCVCTRMVDGGCKWLPRLGPGLVSRASGREWPGWRGKGERETLVLHERLVTHASVIYTAHTVAGSRCVHSLMCGVDTWSIERMIIRLHSGSVRVRIRPWALSNVLGIPCCTAALQLSLPIRVTCISFDGLTARPVKDCVGMW